MAFHTTQLTELKNIECLFNFNKKMDNHEGKTARQLEKKVQRFIFRGSKLELKKARLTLLLYHI